MTDIQKEREAFEDWFSCNAIRDHEYVRGERMDENGNYYSEYAHLAWSAWQAAKANAVPDGFVLMPKEPTGVILKHGSLIKLNNGSTLEIYKAMIEAQESSDD